MDTYPVMSRLVRRHKTGFRGLFLSVKLPGPEMKSRARCTTVPGSLEGLESRPTYFQL